MQTQKWDINVLILDDESDITDLYQSFLKKNCDNVFTATNIIETQKILKNNLIDIAVIDLNVPEADTGQLLKFLKEKYPNISIIINTGDLLTEDERLSLKKQGVTDFLYKPSTKSEILKIIELQYFLIKENKRIAI